MPLHAHIDPFSGIAGDMFIGALLDLGLSLDDLRARLAPLDIQPSYALSAARVQRRGVGAVDFKVVVEAPPAPGLLLNPTSGHGDHVGRKEILGMIDRLDLAERGRRRARRVLDALAQAEARVHGSSPDQVHFHEVGAVDSIIDMLGSCIGLELLGIDSLSCGPLPISRGFVRCEHGKMPVPAPATAYLMEGKPTFGVDRTVELVTPTGAALVAGLADTFGPPPPMTLEKVGYGAGDRDDPETPNVLRIMLGRLTPPSKPDAFGGVGYDAAVASAPPSDSSETHP